ncbi:MAG: flagellar basal body P-ring formation protein FlgA [Alphaproteobacteria bacterium]|nr:flagellar basal body P-ring formation protein FlgA [Alphaproteobacteria bacterium]
MKDIRAALRPLAVMLAAAGVLAALGAPEVSAATLRPHVVVHDDTVRLKDIFDGAGRKGDTALFRAPAPGQSVVLTGRWLRQVARTYELDWRPAPGLDESRVQRSSNLVGHERIRRALHEELKGRVGAAKKFEVALDNPNLELHLPVRMPAEVTVKHLQLDRQSGRFSATLFAPDRRPGAAAVAVAGRVHELIEVPVLTRRMRAGDIIGKDDISLQQLRADVVGRNVLTSPDRIIGMGARHALVSGRPLNGADIREPQLVGRGSIVTMTYRTNNLVITAHGKARENGTAGEVVRVQNLSSGRTVEAIVTGPDTVAVQPLSQITARCTTCR